MLIKYLNPKEQFSRYASSIVITIPIAFRTLEIPATLSFNRNATGLTR